MLKRMDALFEHLVPRAYKHERETFVGFGLGAFALFRVAFRRFLQNQRHGRAILERDLEDGIKLVGERLKT